MNRRMMIPAALALLLSTGGCGSDEPAALTEAEVAALTDSIAAGCAAAATAPAQPSRNLEHGAAAQVVINSSFACPASGHAYAKGNLFATCPTPFSPGSCTVGGMVTIHFGDPVNNLEDCTYASGFVVDGGITMSISGTDLAMKLSLTGLLSVNRKGPTGGLVPLDGCFISLVANTPANTLTGSVCGRDVNRKL